MLNKGRQRGVNLIEMVVALAILGLLLAAVLPSMGEWIRNTNVRNVAETLQNGLQKARMEALRRNRPITFWLVSATGSPDSTCALSASSGAWIVSMDDPAGKCDVAASQTEAPRIIEKFGPGSGASGLTVAGTAANGAAATSVSFNGFGQPIASSANLMNVAVGASDGTGRQLRVRVTSSGGIKMCEVGVAADDARAC